MYKFYKKYELALILAILVLLFLWTRLDESTRMTSPMAVLLGLLFSLFMGFSLFGNVKTGRLGLKRTYLHKSDHPILFWFLICLYAVGVLVFFAATLKMGWTILH